MTTFESTRTNDGGAGTGEWRFTSDHAEFADRAGPFLRDDPALHTVVLSILEGMRAGEARFEGVTPRFGLWTDPGGRPAGYLMWTPPQRPYVSPLGDDAAEGLVAALDGLLDPGDKAPEEIGGPVEGAWAVARAWRRSRPGGRVTQAEAQRLYRLGDLTPPDPAPPGRARVAGEDDRELLADWFRRFHADVGEPPVDRGRAYRWADSRLSYGGVTLWETPDGHPVSMAGVTRRSAATVRVAPVYTPAPLRGKGYAAAATAEVSRAARADGATQVLLFTDLANATSNALYQRLGYRPVRDFTILELKAQEGPSRPEQ
ncbi:GNAT family N-acetyltransferase [Streptomyces sp. NPDC102406]|uniref:GNAT family N-acetyltransferase n=1 Tax=Streptomyces sp. NPDC102406 TaxID=3366171 RepID=UPI00380D0334